MRYDKKIATLERGQFIAEISYITGKPTSADVVSPERLTYYIWNRNHLEKFRKSKPDTMGKLEVIVSISCELSKPFFQRKSLAGGNSDFSSRCEISTFLTFVLG